MKTLVLITLLILTIISTNTQAADEGIKVHGHWTFKIYNPDGSFDRKVEFENSLRSSSPLLSFLNKQALVDNWSIFISGPIPHGPCIDNTNNPSLCIIYEPGTATGGDPHRFTNLTHQIDSLTGKFVLRGNFTVANGITTPSVQSVSTTLSYCESFTSSTCNGGVTGVEFTSTNISVSLNPGQIVQVTVEISFS